jgi:16S rRNA pseudouridine516 synthase
MKESLRLDRYVASVTDYSRSDAKKLIKSGDVTVDGKVLTDPSQAVAADAQLEIDGQFVRQADHRYFMLHKPQDYVCANRDRRFATVMDLLDEDNLDRLIIAGRLDLDTTGLVLLTDNGQWAHQVMSPRTRCYKRYRVQLEDPVPENAIDRFAKGVFLEQEKRRTLPARMKLLGEREALLEICEGRFHQVKRMFTSIGNTVVGLHREAIGKLELDSALGEGEYRSLTEYEVAVVLSGTLE